MLHGDRSQRQREAALGAFERGEVDVLVCTDVAARGLHLERVRTVINYDVPNDPEEYVHRVGRAGHGGDVGEAFTLVGRMDEEKWERIAWSVAEPLPYTEIEGFEPWRPTRSSGAGGSSGAERRSGDGGGGGVGGIDDARDGTKGRTFRTKKASRPGRNRSRNAAKPIPRGEKPGGGIRRPDSAPE
jgi:superfamily II DNA/RNA helicase